MLSVENLRKEGVPEEKVKFVGNIMIDTLEANRDKAAQMAFTQIIEQNRMAEQKSVTFNSQLLEQKPYAVMTLHRPSNVDNREIFTALIRFLLDEVTKTHILIWPIHPRTRKRLEEFSLWEEVVSTEGILLLEPIGYHEMLKLNMGASVMLTDSGGLQEECCVLGTPCLTLRWNTERPVTLREHGGVSILVGNNIERIREEYRNTLNQFRNPQRPELWDGKTAMRCVEAIVNYPQT
jgi:UDP-N-acetylglucosamine 2-epimerase (non-hydrolysing)